MVKYLISIIILSFLINACTQEEVTFEIKINSKIILCNDKDGIYELKFPSLQERKISETTESGTYFGTTFYKNGDSLFYGEIINKNAARSEVNFLVKYKSIYPESSNKCFKLDFNCPLNAPEKLNIKKAECNQENFVETPNNGFIISDIRLTGYNINFDTLKMYVPQITSFNRKGDCIMLKGQAVYLIKNGTEEKIISFTETFDFKNKNGVFDIAIDEEGKRIIYIVWKSRLNDHIFSTENRCELNIYNMETGEQEFLTQSNIRKPKFSPDGKYIAFIDGDYILNVFDIQKKQSMKIRKCNDFIWWEL